MCERMHGRWQRAQGCPASGDISSERWAELSTEIDKVMPQQQSDQLHKAVTSNSWLVSSLQLSMSQLSGHCHQ